MKYLQFMEQEQRGLRLVFQLCWGGVKIIESGLPQLFFPNLKKS